MKPKNLYWGLHNGFMVKKTDTPLIIDEKDSKWVLLGKICNIVGSRRVKQEMAKQGVGPVNMAGVMLRIVLIAMFFSVDISYVKNIQR